MFYYQFNIADYASATAHLSNSEDLAYRRLLDLYYDQEKPLSTDTKWIARRIRISLPDVETVLSEFFTLTELGYMHHRCEFEIQKYHRKADANKINGLKGGRKPSRNPVETQSEPSGLPVETQGLPNGNPRLRQPKNLITKEPNNQEPTQEFMTELSSTPVEKPESGVPFFKVAEVYNAVCVPFGRPEASIMNKKRKSAIARVWNGSAHAKSLEWWRSYFEAAMAIPYMSNGFTKQDGSQWGGADFDYLLQEKTIVKVVERSQ